MNVWGKYALRSHSVERLKQLQNISSRNCSEYCARNPLLYAGKSNGGRMTAWGLFILMESRLENESNHKEKYSLLKYELGSVT